MRALLGMTEARRRVERAGYAAQAQRAAAEEQARAQRAAEEAARKEAERLSIVRAMERVSAFHAPVGRVSKIISEVAQAHDLLPSDLTGHRRLRHLIEPRHEAMWTVRQITGMSLSQIGQHFGGRDHTAVLHGIRKHQAKLDASHGDVVVEREART